MVYFKDETFGGTEISTQRTQPARKLVLVCCGVFWGGLVGWFGLFVMWLLFVCFCGFCVCVLVLFGF